MSNRSKNFIAVSLAVTAAILFLVTHPAWVAATYEDWKHITFHEPAHYIFEFQNEIIVGLILVPVWKRAKRKAVSEAVVAHDAKFHPHSHGRIDSGTESVVK